MDTFVVNTPGEFADYIMDELGRWIAIDCPIAFKSRKFKTPLFAILHDDDDKSVGPLNVKFTRNGYVVVKIFGPTLDAIKVTRFQMADPSLRDQMSECFKRLDDDDMSDFVKVAEARERWKKNSLQ